MGGNCEFMALKRGKIHSRISLQAENLEELYAGYNHRKFVHPDPLEFLYGYPDIHERELVGLIASSLAYGRVTQILKSVASVLKKMDGSPRSFLMESPREEIFKAFKTFRHRFTTGEEIACMLLGAKRVLNKYGSLYECFMQGLKDDTETVLPALSFFVEQVGNSYLEEKNSLLPSPGKGSACKRLNLYLRWMVRKDIIDPGGWNRVPMSKLIIPLDTHMHRICLSLGMTARKQADMRTAVEITHAFKRLSPQDPVRYDFALTRLGIRKDADRDKFLEQCTPTI